MVHDTQQWEMGLISFGYMLGQEDPRWVMIYNNEYDYVQVLTVNTELTQFLENGYICDCFFV